jgi:hypothetical protein
VLAKLTVPLGGLLVPMSVSATVAVHVVALFTAKLAGLQLTVVEVDRLLTAAMSVPLLGA